MSTWQKILLAIVIIGAINWGLIGFFQFDLVKALLGGISPIPPRIVYAIVGLSGLYCITLLFKPREEFEREGRVQHNP
ncbi:DUF378 domain-containing protein [Dehalobacter sp. DCM]|uniref:DUF378 domain-containing protein n=1 Tax=Dehalobacter sp. DCM TaxID=2907827 RepID=UPI003081C51A|nr:DUF378 domain-containing protein [Dehalobacter sp. DCM]